ncbi:DUF2125 domain-containing protein [Roseovarius faecimaris]|uniref:DUF2125 domain-containing protein n=1 Tax=Roseovarius faecimaris TaxID=2494550 RepID=A0A6I6IM25_9RHOB|nr:DUF2125 domain-containing protein [Roseovarius faecimaris]QGX97625.1 DUF2125 domain-containing protein [Roseovarius faecimaris]
MRSLLPFTAASSLALFAAAPTLADVTAEQVWTNMRAPILAMGGQMEASATRKDNRLEIGETVIRLALPMGAGDVSITTSGMSLAENGDGTVALLHPAQMYARFRVDGPQGLLAAAAMTMDGASYSATASGEAGDVTYAYSLGNGSFRLGEVNVPEAPDMQIDMSGSMSGMQGTYRIQEGELLTVTGEGGMGEMSFDVEMVDDLGISSTGRQVLSGGQSGFAMTIPAGKIDLMNLAQGLRDGLAVKVTTEGARLDSTTTSTLDGELLAVQNYGYLTDSISYVLDASGLNATGRNSDIWMEFQVAEALPIPIKATAGAMEGALVMPLNATEGTGPFTLNTMIENLAIDEALWAMIDPGAQLPRDPASLTLNLSGQIELLMDLLDLNRWMQMGPDAQSPVLLHGLTLDALRLDLAGLAVDGEGSFTFDNSDYDTFDGIPAPEGTLSLNASGVNGLIDNLIAMGLISAGEASGYRLMIGSVAVAGDGEDTLRSVIEVKPNGQISANGQRLR